MIKFLYTALFLILGFTNNVDAQSINVSAPELVPRVDISFHSQAGSFEEGAVFEVPILINTRGQSVNSIEIRVDFDPNILSIVQPSAGKSVIGVWIQPPKFDNTRGTASYVGVIPGGINTSSGLISTLTFKSKRSGKSPMSFGSNSKILLNDGLGTQAVSNFGRAEFTIFPKAPQGVVVFSETHPIESDWYNNTSPVISWQKDSNVDGFSYVLDNKPFTIPDNKILTDESSKSFENLSDGLWYFHIKANKSGSWSQTRHFLMRIDTTPPAEFPLSVQYVIADGDSIERALVSFFTTDNLSGIRNFEVGVIDTSQPLTVSPVFVESESPFQVPIKQDSNLTTIVRAVDNAGNIREVSVNIKLPFLLGKFITDNLLYILITIIALGILGIMVHYIFGHYVMKKTLQIKSILDTQPEKENPISQ